MAESNREQFVSKILVDADSFQFAKDLVDYVKFRNSPRYAEHKGSIPRHESALDQITRRVVRFIKYMLEISDYTFRKMLKENSICETAYKTFVKKGAVKYSTTDFDAKKILIFSATIMSKAALFYNNGITEAPEIAITHINSVLQRYNMAAGEWDALSRIAQQFDNLLGESKPLIAHSSEIEPLMSSKKVTGYGSMNVISSEEHNYLSDNEDNLEQKQDCVCSKLETFLEKIAQYFSGKSTDIGTLEEPESSLEDSAETFNFEGNKSINKSESNVKLSSGTENKLKLKPYLPRNVISSINSKRMQFTVNLIDKRASDDSFIPGPSSSSQNSDLTNKSNYRGELNTGVNVKNNKYSERLTTEEDEFIGDSSSLDEFLMDTSNTYQTSSFTSARENIDLPSNEKICAESPSIISDGNSLAKTSEPDEKLFSETSDSNQTSKEILDGSSYNETNANAENAPVTD